MGSPPILEAIRETITWDGIVADGAEKGAIGGWARLDAVLTRLAAG
jgi:hypothetical protein